jgi:hypothetical protein
MITIRQELPSDITAREASPDEGLVADLVDGPASLVLRAA